MAGLFGAPRRLPQVDTLAMGIMPGDQPTVGMGDFPPMGVLTQRRPWPGVPQQAQPAQQRKPYQDTLAGKLGMAGQILSNRGRRNPMLEYQMQQQVLEQQMRAREQAAQQQRQWGNEDWMQRQQWQRANPEPREPDAFERALAGANIDPTSQQGQQLFRARAESMARDPMDEYVVVPIPGVGTYAGPRSGLADVTGGQRPRNLGPIVDTIPGGPGGSPSGAGFRP